MIYNNRIKVTNTAIVITNYRFGECETLENKFKIYDPVRHSFYYIGLYYDKDSKNLYLPAGIDLWWVKKCLDERFYNRIDNHPYKTIDNILIKYRPRDVQQEQALRFMVGLGEYEENINCNSLVLSLPTGKGKTYCSIATISFFKIKSMIITSSNSLLSQWESEILKYTNLESKDIFRISGSDLCNMIINGKSNKANTSSIYLCTHGTLRSFGDRYGWDKVYELFEYLGIGIKIYDEAHTSYENMLMIDFFTNVYKTYYVTATPGRSNWKENNIFQISLKNVPMIDLFDENNDPHTDYIAIKWNSKPSAEAISKCKNVYGLDRMKYVDYITRKPEFYDMMRIIMDLVIKCKGKVLMYIGTNEGILRVYNWIGHEYPEFVGDIGIFTSLLSKEQKLAEKNKKILLSTTKSAGLGEHIEGLKMTIVLAELFKSDILAKQTLGRTRDNNTMYIELVDLGFLYIRKFYYAKLPIFHKYANSVSDTTIDNYELRKRADVIAKDRDKLAYNCITMHDERFEFEEINKPELSKIKPVVKFYNK